MELINRQDAIDAVSDCGICIQKIVDLPSAQTGTGWTGIEDDYPVSVKAVLNITAETGALETQRRVRELPPMQKAGKWKKHILKDAKVQWGYNCSSCGEWFVIGQDYIKRYLYCPNCGASMRGDYTNENISDS